MRAYRLGVAPRAVRGCFCLGWHTEVAQHGWAASVRSRQRRGVGCSLLSHAAQSTVSTRWKRRDESGDRFTSWPHSMHLHVACHSWL